MNRGSITKVSLAAVLAAVLAACTPGPKPSPVIGEAYVGPVQLNIRADIPLQSATVATVKHGEKLEILGRRRRYLRVRTQGNAEGWTDERQLLSSEDMQNLRELAKRAASMPTQGRGTTYAELNVHTQPSRQSPSFVQVKENEKFDVLAQITSPRADLPRKPLIQPAEKKAPPKKKPPKQPKYPPPPMPKPPPTPENWLELSRTDMPEDEEDAREVKPLPVDSWSLVRVDGGQSGWVLTRRVTMAIPDEVAQYAEGKRIVSYFPLGYVDDGGEKKYTWLWTTASGSHEYDFDSIRVFTWGLRRHRYETAYIDRKLNGYAPVLLREVEYGKQKYPGFSICAAKEDGTRARREYAVMGNTVRYAGELPCEPPVSVLALNQPTEIKTAPEPAAEPEGGFVDRVKKRVTGWFKK